MQAQSQTIRAKQTLQSQIIRAKITLVRKQNHR